MLMFMIFLFLIVDVPLVTRIHEFWFPYGASLMSHREYIILGHTDYFKHNFFQQNFSHNYGTLYHQMYITLRIARLSSFNLNKVTCNSSFISGDCCSWFFECFKWLRCNCQLSWLYRMGGNGNVVMLCLGFRTTWKGSNGSCLVYTLYCSPCS